MSDGFSLPADGTEAVKSKANRRKPPSHFDVFFGFSARVLVALVALVFSTIIIFAWGWTNNWRITNAMLTAYGLCIAITVLFGEHIRSRAFERILTKNNKEKDFIKRETINSDISKSPEENKLGKYGLDKEVNRKIKRVIDFSIAVSAIIILLPFFLALACLIVIESRGPIFFHTGEILGPNGRKFRAVKFRTARIEKARQFDLAWETTRVGRFLRVTNLDELPMLLNVLSGDMSLIGTPRITQKSFDTSDGEKRKIFAEILSINLKPGIAAVGRNEENLDARANYIRRYYHGWSVLKEAMVIISIIRREIFFISRI